MIVQVFLLILSEPRLLFIVVIDEISRLIVEKTTGAQETEHFLLKKQ